MKKVSIWTDGACSGNPGPGGWGALMRFGEHERSLYGGDPDLVLSCQFFDVP